MMPRVVPLLAAAVIWLTPAAAVNISNIVPRRSTDGAIVDQHDGNIVFQNGTYYWFAAGYGECAEPPGANGCGDGFNGCGFFSNHSVNLLTSSDLFSWTAHGNVLPVATRAPGILFSPKAMYNARTQLWVLWYNYLDFAVRNYSYAVAVSASPYGPFVTVDTMAGATTQFGYPNNTHIGDFSLLVDDDGTGYLLYSGGHHVQLEKLTDDYLASTWVTTNQTSGVFPHGSEAPALFKRGGWYYALISDTCCYCGQGGLVHAYRAAAPLGPYEYLGEIAQGPNKGAWGGDVATSSQQTATVSIGGRLDANATVLWVGDRWQSAPDGLKAHDFTFWEPLQFFLNGSIAHMAWMDSFTVGV